MKRTLTNLIALFILISFSSCNWKNKTESDNFYNQNTSPQVVGVKVTDDLLSRKEFMMYKTPDVRAVHYAEACATFGAVRLAGLMNDTLRLKQLSERHMKVIDEDIENTENHVDVNVYGILPLELYLQLEDEKFLQQGLHLADKQWEDPLDNGLTNQTRFWIDDVWMIGSLQVQAYRVTGDTIYLERAALEIDAYLRKLQQPNGLFFHGEGAPFHWGRGNGWVAAGLAELLSELPENNPYYNSILEGYRKMMNALLKYQAEDGMWRQLIDNENAWKETSSTAMFGYAFSVPGVLELMGIKLNVPPLFSYRPKATFTSEAPKSFSSKKPSKTHWS